MIITCGCPMTVSRSFASSHRTKTLRHVPETSRRTGLTLAFFFDSCVAWREGENSDTVVPVEFKKPMRDNYTVGRDPVRFRSTSVEREACVVSAKELTPMDAHLVEATIKEYLTEIRNRLDKD